MWGLVDFPNLFISQTANRALVDGKTVGGEEGAQSGATVPGPGGRTVCLWSLRVISNPREGLSRNNDNDNNRESSCGGHYHRSKDLSPLSAPGEHGTPRNSAIKLGNLICFGGPTVSEMCHF